MRSWCSHTRSRRSSPSRPYSSSQREKQSAGVRTTMALLTTVVPPTHDACTIGQSARLCVTSAPQSGNMSRIVPSVVVG